jgi:hypothetical protein
VEPKRLLRILPTTPPPEPPSKPPRTPPAVEAELLAVVVEEEVDAGVDLDVEVAVDVVPIPHAVRPSAMARTATLVNVFFILLRFLNNELSKRSLIMHYELCIMN